MKFLKMGLVFLTLSFFMTEISLAGNRSEAMAKFERNTKVMSSEAGQKTLGSKLVEAWQRMNKAGVALAKQNFKEACERYEAIYKDYGLANAK